jgi:hypothetical protein
LSGKNSQKRKKKEGERLLEKEKNIKKKEKTNKIIYLN